MPSGAVFMSTLQFLKRIPLFRELSAEELEAWQGIFQEREFKKNQIVFLEEETGNYMYIVKYGEVKAVQTSTEGRENILAIHHSGETFGEMSLLDGKTAPATVVAMEDTRLITISKSNFDSFLMKNPKILLAMLQILSSKLRDAWKTIQTLKYTDAETRLRRILQNLVRSEGVQREDGIQINMKITHQDLAEMAGTSRETISRLLSRLQNQQLIRITARKLILLDHAYWRE